MSDDDGSSEGSASALATPLVWIKESGPNVLRETHKVERRVCDWSAAVL